MFVLHLHIPVFVVVENYLSTLGHPESNFSSQQCHVIMALAAITLETLGSAAITPPPITLLR